MKRFFAVCAMFFLITYGLRGQERAVMSLTEETHEGLSPLQEHDTHALPGCRVLMEENVRLKQHLKEHPEILQQQRLMKRTAWAFQIGDPGPVQSSGWWATNLNTSDANYNKEYLVASTCRAVGANCYIFVENSLWGGRVTQAGVDSILAAWESRTPANADKGIYRLDTETFGFPPNVDSDNRIVIIILDIKDGYAGSGGYIAGYYFALNQFPDNTVIGGVARRSNEAEIYYIDGDPGNFTTTNGLNVAASTTAHEFQHMINWNYNQQTDTFNNEACSEVASLVCGYAYTGQSLYTNNTDTYLIGWSNNLADYSRAARWALYLWNQFPNNYLAQWVQNTGLGVTRMNSAFTAYTPTTTRRFAGVFNDWLVANHLQDQSVDTKYGYTYQSSLTKPSALNYVNPNTGTVNATVNRLGADYISFTNGSNLSIAFTAQSSGLAIKAVKIGESSKTVEDVTVGVQYNVPDFGTTYTSVSFVVINTLTGTTPISYSYTATGSGASSSTELKWDTTEPVGLLRLTPLDTVSVLFPAVPGARLDSVRVALRRTGTMNGGIWTIGQTAARPLGIPLVKPITVSTDYTTPVTNPAGPYPYPIPYPNWRTIDLRSYNIILNQDFAVGFWHSADTSQDAYVMVTRYESESPYNSFTYMHNPSSGSPGWYYLSDGEGNIFLYLVRAYASFGGAPVPPAAPALVSPEDGAIDQVVPLTLEWGAAGGATSYHLQVSTDQNFSSLILDEQSITATSFLVSTLDQAATYYWRVRATNSVGTGEFSPARRFTTMRAIPTQYALSQNFPNPFNPGTTIRYELPEDGRVRLQIIDVLGRLVTTLVDGEQPAGSYETLWDGKNNDGLPVSSGVYFCRLESGSFSEIKRMMLLK